MLVGALVLGAIGFAVATQAPPPPSANAGSENLAQETWDAVDALNSMHYPDTAFGNSVLSKAVADAAAGNATPLADSLAKFMPPGSQFQVYLNNGYDSIPLYTNRTPDGQTVGIAYPFEPNWKYHYGETDLRIYNSNSSLPALGLNLIPIFNSNHVEDEGQYVRARFSGEQGYLPGRDTDEINLDSDDPLGEDSSINVIQKPFIEDAYTTLLQGNDTESYPSASIYMRCERSPNDQPCYGMDFTNEMDGYGPTGVDTDNGFTWYRVDIVVDNEGPGELPVGTTLTVRYPTGLPVNENVTSPASKFTSITYDGSPEGPMTVQASLDQPLSTDETAELRTWVRVADQRFAYKHIDAYLGGGAASQSNFLTLVAKKSWGPSTGGDTRVALISAPKPAGSLDGTTNPHGRWGIVLPTPVGPVDLEHLNLTITEGEGRFASAAYPEDFDPTYSGFLADSQPVTDGSLSVSKGSVQWTGEHRGDGYSFIEIQFNLTTDGTSTAASPQFPLTRPDARFTGYVPPPQTVQVEPGIWWREYPPATESDHPEVTGELKGYGATGSDPSDGDPVKTTEIQNHLIHRNQHLNGTSTYLQAALGPQSHQGAVKDASTSSRLTTDPQRVLPGEQVNFTLSMDDLATYLGENGIHSLDLQTSVYAPWGIRDLTPIKTFTHETAAGSAAAPTALMPAFLNTNQAQDIVMGATDGNVYGLDGPTGDTIPGRVFALPEAKNATSTVEPNLLTRSVHPGVGQIYGVGTTAGISKWYSLDEDLDERWAAVKPEGGVTTLALNTSWDLTGDGIPEFIAATSVAESNTPYGRSRLTLYDGVDQDGDGLGDILTGWTNASTGNGIRVNGSPSSVGFANLGPNATGGIFANTGLHAGTNVLYEKNATLEDAQEGDIEGLSGTVLNASLGVKDSGLVGLFESGTPAWNFTGGRFTEVARADRMDLGQAPSGRNHSGLVAAGGDGWVYGFNASKALIPSTGWTMLGATVYDDVAMANPLEGYLVSSDGFVMGTRDGWTTMFGNGVSSQYLSKLNAVDTPDGPMFSGYGNVSWWAGDQGALLRSTDRLATMENLTSTATLSGALSTDVSNDTLTGAIASFDSLDLTKVNFHDVLAVSRDEAWFVGEGASGTTLDDYGFIVHTTDGGETLRATRLTCQDGDQVLSGCGLEGIADDGERVWIVGDYGLVLTQDRSGQASHVDMQGIHGPPGVNANGRLIINVTADEPVQIQNITVDWRYKLRLSWMRGASLNDGTGHVDLWNKTEGKPYMEDPSTNHSDKGAARNTTLYIKQYVNNVAGHSDSDRDMSGDSTIILGPFRQTSQPSLTDPDAYFGQDWYKDTDDTLTWDPRPHNWTVVVEFEDGSEDHYRVQLLEDGQGEDWQEIEGLGWVTPSQAGYSAPARCFGLPEANCTTYHSINFTHNAAGELVGALAGETQADPPQSPLTRMAAGSGTFERVWDPRVNQTFYDVAISLQDPDRWVAVGPGPTLARSYDAGEDWRVLPTLALYGEGSGQPLLAADYTHPSVASLVGGSGMALQWYAGGYAEWGQVRTVDLWNGSDDLKRIDFNHSKFLVGMHRAGTSEVTVEVWDPGLNGGAGGWATVFEAPNGWKGEHPPYNESIGPSGEEVNGKQVEVEGKTYEVLNGTGWPANYNFTQPTDEIRLRFELRTKTGFSPQSPEIRGQLKMLGHVDDTDFDATPDLEFDLDLNHTSQFEASTLSSLDHGPENGYFRLTPVQNPWIWRLGNYQEGDWSIVDQSDNGVRPADMELAPDGHTLYVGTEGIYKWAAAQSATPIGYDNSLYAINVSTGEPEDGWPTPRFTDPIREISVGPEAVYVLTRETGETVNATVHRILRTDGSVNATTSAFTSGSAEEVLEVVDAFTNSTMPDMVTGYRDTQTNGGILAAYVAPDLGHVWSEIPVFNDTIEFTYTLPRNAMYGAYVTVSKVNWTITDTYGEDIVQSARVHNSFSVTPPTHRVPLAPTYNLEVVAWMEDWG